MTQLYLFVLFRSQSPIPFLYVLLVSECLYQNVIAWQDKIKDSKCAVPRSILHMILGNSSASEMNNL